MRKLLLFLALFFTLHVSAQTNAPDSYELGVHMNYAGSKYGYNYGPCIQFGIPIKDYLLVGPSLRYDRVEYKEAAPAFAEPFNAFGIGILGQVRFAKVLSIGFEAHGHYVKNDIWKVSGTGSLTQVEHKKAVWFVTAFATLGACIKVHERVKVHAAVAYDVFNRSYFLDASYPLYQGGGEHIPVRIAYRLGAYISLGKIRTAPN